MKKFLLQMSSVGLLLAGLQAVPIYAADDEGKAPVPTQSDSSNPDSTVYRASDVMNMPVKDDAGNEVGKIKDFVINGETREVLYAVVAMNDSKEKDALYVMPWNAFQPNYAQGGNALQYTVLTLPQNVWLQAPFYSQSQWRSTPFSQWGPRVNNYYSQHITVNNTSRGKTFSANKPATADDKKTDDKKDADADQKKPGRDDSAKDSDKPSQKDDKPAAKPNKENADKPSKESADKPAPSKPNNSAEPKQSDKPSPKTNAPAPKVEQPKEGGAKLPAPKNPDPAGPNTQS